MDYVNNLIVRWNEWLTVPVDYSILPLSSQLAITVWDLSPAGGEGAKGHHIPFGGTTISLFDKDGTLRQGRQKCQLYRHKPADGLSTTKTPAIPSPSRHASQRDGDKDEEEEDEVARLEKLLKKHEMGEMPKIDWLDQLTFRAIEQRGLLTRDSAERKPKGNSLKDRSNKEAKEDDELGRNGAEQNGQLENGDSTAENDGDFILFVDFPRFDFPIVFTDHEYPPPSISSQARHTPGSSTVTLKPPPGLHGPASTGAVDSDGNPVGGRIVKVYDPEVFARDNPAESMHRRLVRSHRTNLLDRDLKPNAKIRDELHVSCLKQLRTTFHMSRHASLLWQTTLTRGRLS